MRFEHDATFHAGAQLGAQLGLNLVPTKHGWLALLARYDRAFIADIGYGALTVAAALRR